MRMHYETVKDDPSKATIHHLAKYAQGIQSLAGTLPKTAEKPERRRPKENKKEGRHVSAVTTPTTTSGRASTAHSDGEEVLLVGSAASTRGRGSSIPSDTTTSQGTKRQSRKQTCRICMEPETHVTEDCPYVGKESAKELAARRERNYQELRASGFFNRGTNSGSGGTKRSYSTKNAIGQQQPKSPTPSTASKTDDEEAKN